VQTFDNSALTGGNNGSAPGIDPNASVPLQREEQKPAANGTSPGPGDDVNQTPPSEDPYKVEKTDSSTLNAPKLFDPNDRTAQRSIAPVKTAVYWQSVAHRQVSTQRVTAEQVRQVAAGWSSVGK
jgi:hypothetical protein